MLVSIIFPIAFHISLFSIHSSSLDFIHLYFTVALSAPRHKPLYPPPLPGLENGTAPQSTLRHMLIDSNNYLALLCRSLMNSASKFLTPNQSIISREPEFQFTKA